MIDRCSGFGKNPYTVNVITFSGHGLTYDGDTIAVIPELPDRASTEKDLRFINMSGIARKFAAKNYSINLFLMSMCRSRFDERQLKEIYEKSKDLENGEENGPTFIYKYLNQDTLSKADRHIGHP